jgi:hypothetical protein
MTQTAIKIEGYMVRHGCRKRGSNFWLLDFGFGWAIEIQNKWQQILENSMSGSGFQSVENVTPAQIPKQFSLTSKY